jgi:hypothetical protein
VPYRGGFEFLLVMTSGKAGGLKYEPLKADWKY